MSKRLEMRARRAARRVGERVCKSRSRTTSIDNHGGYMIVNNGSIIGAGARYDLTLGDLLERYQVDVR